MTTEQKIQLDLLRTEAKKVQYYENPQLSAREALMFTTNVLPETRCLALPEILKRNLSDYTVFFAISSWCDTEEGLCVDYPEEIITVAKALKEKYGPKKQ